MEDKLQSAKSPKQENIDDSSSEQQEQAKKGCTECRLVGGIGGTAAALYAAYNARTVKNFYGKTFMLTFAAGLATGGLMRLFNFTLADFQTRQQN